MKILSVLTTFAAAIIFFTFNINPARALEVYQQGNLLFSDSFSSSTITGWNDEIGTGGWSINNGNLLGVKTSTLKTGRLTNASVWDNYSIEVDINNNSGIDEGVGFRRTSLNSTYEVTLRHGTGMYGTPEIKLVKTQNGITSVLKSVTSTPLVNQVWYHLKIESVKEHIQVWLDSNLIMDIDDPGTEVKTGGVSLSFWTGDYGISIVRFDNVKVNSLTKQLNPVIFIPGIGGSEFKASQDIVWSKDDGHSGTYSHAYTAGEKVWVNEEEAAKLGDDDYFDVLKLKTDGQTPEADVTLTGNLTPFGYPDIDSFFTNLGYEKGKTYFVYPYDWRKDITTTKQGLDDLVELAKQKSGMTKVNIVAHSMGGLVARYYIADSTKASKVNKLIELGVPHLGSVKALKAIMYGTWITYDFYFLKMGIIPASEIKDLFVNFPSAFELQPSSKYYSFYDNTNNDNAYPFFDDRDIDNDKEMGALNYSQAKDMLNNLNYNTVVFNSSELFHSYLDPLLQQNNNVKIYLIAGSGQPTLGQMREGWLINWPIKIIPKYDELYINGDETVPLYSASLKSPNLDLSAEAKIYYVEQKHSDLVTPNSLSMQTVKAILNEGDTIPVEVHSEKITLEGEHISVDQDANLDLYDEDNHHTGIDSNGTLETNIPNTFFDNLGDTKHIFVKKSAKKVKVKVSSPKTKKNTPTVKIRRYSNDKISKTTLYNKVPITDKTTIEFEVDPTVSTAPILIADGQSFPPTSEVIGDGTDYTPPTTTATITGSKDSSGNYSGGVSIVLTGTDNNSGILNTEYSLDNGTTVQTYTNPITITTNGSNQIIVKSTDRLGNEEIPQTLTFNITASDTGTPVSTSTIETPTPTPTTTTSSSSDNSPTSSPTPSPTINFTPTYGHTTPTPIIIKLTKNDFPPGYSKILDPLPVNNILGEKIKKAEVQTAVIQPPPLLLFGVYTLLTLLFPTALLIFRMIPNSDLNFSDIRKNFYKK